MPVTVTIEIQGDAAALAAIAAALAAKSIPCTAGATSLTIPATRVEDATTVAYVALGGQEG